MHKTLKRFLTPISPKVFVALSGGVDSSVAAFLLKKKGYGITGVFMRCYNLDGCAATDAEDARRLANHLKIPFYVFDFEEEYKQKVVSYIIESYRENLTPNPDVMCNKQIKFGLFLRKALKLGADYIATGHYARLKTKKTAKSGALVRPQNGPGLELLPVCSLYQAKDQSKDQTYFLWTLTQDQLKHCLFPIGKYKKPKVREIAKRAGLPTAEKKDSQGICFLGKVSLIDFLKKYLPVKTGSILDTNGNKIGEHDGAWFYTIGQRHLHLPIYGSPTSIYSDRGNPPPLYITEKNIKNNTITLAPQDHPLLFKKEITLSGVNFLNPDFQKNINPNGQTLMARIRYRQPLQRATLKTDPRGTCLVFTEKQKSVAPGQSAVLYGKRGQLLGGGIIQKAN